MKGLTYFYFWARLQSYRVGCAVLTKSQVKEVKAFAEVSQKYGTLPGEPIRAYGHIVRTDRILNVSARDFSEEDARILS